jgi:hypothetical protein
LIYIWGLDIFSPGLLDGVRAAAPSLLSRRESPGLVYGRPIDFSLSIPSHFLPLYHDGLEKAIEGRQHSS